MRQIASCFAGWLPASVLAMAMAALATAQTASFQGLGQMPGADPGAGTFATAISGDKSTIVGWAWVCPNGEPTCTSTGKTEAFRWTAAGKYQVLGDLGSSVGSMALAVSFDGSVVVGNAPAGQNSFGAFRWTAAQGLMALPLPLLFGYAVTPDGNMVAGGDYWWNTSGQSGQFGPFPGNPDQTSAFGLAGTVTAPVAVGSAINGSGAGGATFHAFRWTPAGGLQDLQGTGSFQSTAAAISANGAVVVGQAYNNSGFSQAFRWTASSGMQGLGTLGGPESIALAVNKDGSVIVGTSLTSGSSGSSQCFRWTAKTGMQNILTLLQAAGVHTADNWIQLNTLDGVSADGTVIVGYGLNPPSQKYPFGVWTPFRVVLLLP